MNRICWLVGLLILTLLTPAKAGPAPMIPELAWQERSDWINVKTDVTPRAIGDGLADDTAALQAALDAFTSQSGKPNTIYLPPGTYRITRTLVITRQDGLSVIGHGRSTRIAWNGPGGSGDDARMIWSNGAPRSRYVGIVWDGRGRAHVGFDHDSKNLFETEIDHKHEAFVHFTGSGLRVGHQQLQASAETTVTNCLFEDCDRGVSLLQFNDYNFTFSGCEFRDCGTAVFGGKGCNFYVRDSHFERSRSMDILVRAEHGCSVRRCTSTGSRLFIDHRCIAQLTMQDCQVSSWTHDTGAVLLNGGPTLLFDCAFSRPPNRNAPVMAARGQELIVSQNQSEGTDGVVKHAEPARLLEVPAGQRRGSLTSPQQSFLAGQATVSGKILDARRDFRAKGDGRADDTAAIQAAIDAARQGGQGAIAYLPSGDYIVTKTLHITGADYSFGGSGTHTRLIWKGDESGTMITVHDPNNLTIENMDVGTAGDQKNAIDILQTGSAAGSMAYERVHVYGIYARQPFHKGVHFRDLPQGTVIRADHLTGNLRFTNCARANILLNSSYEGAVLVEGRDEEARDGVLGFMTRLATINPFGLYVRDSQSLVMSDYYVEQADRFMQFTGQKGDPAGRATIQMPKTHCTKNPVIEVSNYHGRIVLSSCQFYPGGIHPAEILQQGENPLWLLLTTTQAYQVTPMFQLGESAQLVLAGNTGRGMGENRLPEGAMRQLADALDDLRRLGELDLSINHGGTRDDRAGTHSQPGRSR